MPFCTAFSVVASSEAVASSTTMNMGLRMAAAPIISRCRSEEHTSELQSPCNLVCRLLLEKKKIIFLVLVVVSVVLTRIYIHPVSERYVDITFGFEKYNRTIYRDINITLQSEDLYYTLKIT